MKKRVEILAPAGSMTSLQASFKAGADAVYMGGRAFGARAYANNPDDTGLIDAINYAHLRGKRLYLTVNTLIKDSETEELISYLSPLYKAGLDAVIVQDLGTVRLIRENFPELPIHISTQMSVTDAAAAECFSKQVNRIVPARELTINEIARLKKETGLEIEVFVHGALCYCFSGQCLFSSMHGGRSGNRGRCAQPCRKSFVYKGQEKHFLSPKDICTLDMLPRLIEAGVDSFKIEGRMKSPEYACGVSEIYARAVSRYYELGSEGYAEYVKNNKTELASDKLRLADLFNRGGFSHGYAFDKPGDGMMACERPNHNGVFVGKAGINGNFAKLKLVTDVYKGDVLEIRSESRKDWFSYTAPKDFSKGSEISFKAFAGKSNKASENVEVFRIKREALFTELRNKYVESADRVKVCGSFTIEAGKKTRFELETSELNPVSGKKYSICTEGLAADFAKTAPIDEVSIREKLKRSSDSDFEFENLLIKTDGKAFMPKSALGELRRNALEELGRTIREDFKRKSSPFTGKAINSEENEKPLHEMEKPEKSRLEEETVQLTTPKFLASVKTIPQLGEVLNCPEISGVILDSNAFSDYKEAAELIRKSGKELYLSGFSFPDFTPEEKEDKTKAMFAEMPAGIFAANINRMGELRRFKKAETEEQTDETRIFADKLLYTANSYAAMELKELGCAGVTLSHELDKEELKGLIKSIRENGMISILDIYGKEQLMVSRQRLPGTEGKNITEHFSDREGRSYVAEMTENGEMFIYDDEPTNLCARTKELGGELPDCFRLVFIDEDRKMVKDVLSSLFAVNGQSTALKNSDKTVKAKNFGHFDLGVL